MPCGAGMWPMAGLSGGRRPRWIGWGVLVALLVALVWLHPRLDALLVADGFHILDRPGYRRLHQWYLTISTVQWAVAVVLAGATIRTWRVTAVLLPSWICLTSSGLPG